MNLPPAKEVVLCISGNWVFTTCCHCYAISKLYQQCLISMVPTVIVLISNPRPEVVMSTLGYMWAAVAQMLVKHIQELAHNVSMFLSIYTSKLCADVPGVDASQYVRHHIFK